MYKDKTILIIQPGLNGDIINELPIAKYYCDKGFSVEWLCPKEYHQMFRNISYCTPIEYTKDQYFDVIDLTFGFGGPPERWWQMTKPRWKSFIEAKYHLARVEVSERYNLVWDRDVKREKSLARLLNATGEYYVFHDLGSKGPLPLDLERDYRGIRFEKVQDYNVFDWYEVLSNAKEIHCTSSLLYMFVDSAFRENTNKYLHLNRKIARGDELLPIGWKLIDYEEKL